MQKIKFVYTHFIIIFFGLFFLDVVEPKQLRKNRKNSTKEMLIVKREPYTILIYKIGRYFSKHCGKENTDDTQ